jgi:hypothetical protein
MAAEVAKAAVAGSPLKMLQKKGRSMKHPRIAMSSPR